MTLIVDQAIVYQISTSQGNGLIVKLFDFRNDYFKLANGTDKILRYFIHLENFRNFRFPVRN